MKTLTPRDLHGGMLRDILIDLGATPDEAAKYLRVSRRSMFRWLAEGDAPFAVLAALWHETRQGRYAVSLDVGNEAVIYRGLAASQEHARNEAEKRLARLLAICETGAANDAFNNGPSGPGGGFPTRPRYAGPPGAPRRHRAA
jgi:hypothetical protein